MERAATTAEFLRDPIGRWVVPAAVSVVYCASSTLAGCVVWGSPTAGDTELVLEAFGALEHPRIAPPIDFIVDGRGIESIDKAAVASLVGWVRKHQKRLALRVRRQVGVVGDNVTGLALAGIFPVFGALHSVQIARDAELASVDLSPETRAAWDEITSVVETVRGSDSRMAALRDLMRDSPGEMSLERAARALSMSVRSLQRLLTEHGTSFSVELRDARFTVARDLLVTTTEKVAAIAARVGLSQTALFDLVREKAGTTPARLRHPR